MGGREVAVAARITTLRAVTSEELHAAGAPDGTVIAVLLGSDARMR